VGIEHSNARRRRNKEATVEAMEATVDIIIIIIIIIITRRSSYAASPTRKGMATAIAGLSQAKRTRSRNGSRTRSK
jgi:hypothetical protein